MTHREKVEERMRLLTEQAKLTGVPKAKNRTAIQNGSSLHKIIKTPEQAAAFMKALKAAEAE